MKRRQINTIFLIIALILVGFNLYRYYMSWRQSRLLPDFEVSNVRILNNLEPRTIVHYELKNNGSTTANYVITAVSPIDGNDSLPAYFEKVLVGETVSINRKIPLENYTKLKIGVNCLIFSKAKYYIVAPNLEPDIPTIPDFIIYNLSLTPFFKNNITVYNAVFSIMNIGGSPAHNVNISVETASSIIMSVLPENEPSRVTIVLDSLSWEGIEVYITCDEGVRQLYYLEKYNLNLS